MLQLLALSHNKFSGQIPAPEGANQLGDKCMSIACAVLGTMRHMLVPDHICMPFLMQSTLFSLT